MIVKWRRGRIGKFQFLVFSWLGVDARTFRVFRTSNVCTAAWPDRRKSKRARERMLASHWARCARNERSRVSQNGVEANADYDGPGLHLNSYWSLLYSCQHNHLYISNCCHQQPSMIYRMLRYWNLKKLREDAITVSLLLWITRLQPLISLPYFYKKIYPVDLG